MSSYRTRENVNVEARIEGDAVRTIEYAHVAIHDDGFVIANDYVASVDTASPRVYLITAPSDLELHMILQVNASAGALLQVYKDPTFSDSGTAILNLRPNLWSTKTTATTTHSPTVSDDGDLIFQTRNPGNSATNANNRVGGSTRSGEEIILPGGRSLLFRITVEANGTSISFANEYYEVPSGATNNE